MTFLPELKRLMDAATKGPWFIERDDRPNMEWNNHILEEKGGTTVCFMAHSGYEDNSRHENAAELIAYLVNRAPAIAELVEAAEKANEMHIAELWELEEAIAKLNGGKHEG